jgi:hypothetical protein
MAKNKYISHDFYCINCGHKSIPIMRNRGHAHASKHRKRLYCPYCKVEVNHIEVRNLEEKEWFLKKFNEGFFKEEAEESIKECRGA